MKKIRIQIVEISKKAKNNLRKKIRPLNRNINRSKT